MEYHIHSVRTKKEIIELLAVVGTTWVATYTNEARGLDAEIIKNYLSKKYNSEYIEKRYKMLKDSNKHNWVAKTESGEIVGWIGCEINEGNIGGFGIYVLPEHQHKGIGIRFLKRAMKWLKKADRIEINALEYNTRTIELYKKMGFQFNGKKDDFILGDFIGKGWSLRMEKQMH